MASHHEHPVTWLLPVKNGMPYLRETLAAIATQRYHRQQVIAWDNGSTDDSIDELKEWVPKRIPGVVVDDQPMGLGSSLALMVLMADTEFCARIDSDDLPEPGRLRAQVAYLHANPDVAVLGTGLTVIDPSGRSRRVIRRQVCRDPDVRWCLRFGNPLAHPTVMFRRSMIVDVGNYADLMPGQDMELWSRVARRYGMANLPDPLLRLREHSRQVSVQDPARRVRLDREGFERTAPRLFPGLDLDQAARLFAMVRAGPDDHSVTPSDLRALVSLAVTSAREAGLSSTYFLRGRAFRRNLLAMTRRCALGSPSMGPFIPPARLAARLLGVAAW